MSEANEQQRAKSSRTQRIITGAVLCSALAGVLAVGGWLFVAAVFIAIAIAIYEESDALIRGGHKPIIWTSYASLAVSVPLIMFYSSLTTIPILVIMSFFVMLLVMRRQEPDLTDIMVSVLPMLTLVLPGMCLLGIANTEPRGLQTLLLIMVFTVAVGGDTFAYFVGSAIGGPKLCPKISPNKTISGAIGGLIGSVVLALLTGWVMELCLPDYAGFPPFWANMLVGFIAGFAGQMGDLFASMVKRHCKIKDFGNIFPGHGGMLDRMDSIVFVAIIIYSYRVILQGL